ncbi:MAG TPA: lamin tail domain-containing protein, partial [Tepidisphaeraceae bacterium]
MSVRDVIAGRGGKSSSKQVRVQQLRDAARPCAGALLRAAGTLDPLEQRMMLSANDVIINEIMYNSATFETADEYVELYNKGTTPVSLNGWKLAKGVDYTFGNTTINAGAYLVVAADLSRFASKYPGVSNVVGPWVGQLANSSDSIRLEDNLGRQVDQIDYADDGEWAARRRGGEAPKAVTGITASGTTATVTAPGHGYANGNQVAIFGANQAGFDGIFTIANVSGNTFTVTVPAGTPATATGQIYVRRADHNHFGWDWFNPSDGMGKSLELVNANLPNNNGENWGPSIPDNGTPGAANSIAATNSAPLINDLQHFPLVPKSTEQVTVTATVTDELKTGLSVQAFYRNDGAASFNSIAMFDDGLHGDGSANDGVYGARLPAQPNNTIVEFYVKATDSTAHSRTWPGPTDVTGVQGANALYQVDDRSYSSTNPLFKIIMSADEANELAVLRGSSDDLSNAAFNATFISSDGTGSDLRYLVGVRNRGGGSRSSGAPVANYHINFGDFNTWHNKVKINLNAIYSADEVVASALASRAGVPAQWVTDVQVRVNNVDLSTNGANVKMFGLYSYVEDEDKQMVENHFPTDDQGNYYRGIDGGHNAGLQFVDNNPASYQVKYPKQTNVEANDYTDLINLTKALDPNQTPDASFAAAINAQIDVKEWMRYFAFNVLVGNGETALGTGYGDDYALYRGVIDPKFKLVAHDLDTVLGFGDTNVAQNRSIFVATNVATIKRLLQFPDFAPIYFQTLREMIDTVWNPTELGRVIHHAMDDIAGKATADTLVADALARAQAALAQIPQTLAVTGTPTKVNGYAQVTNTAALTLSGSANALVSNARILVNGRAASYTPYQGAWSITNTGNTLGLVGGLNRVLVQEMDGGNKEVARTFVDVWYSVPAGTSVSGAITGSTVWSPANGPYRVTANVTVNAGATLTIQPGTSVYFANGTRLTVNGLLNAVGTDTQRIRFTHDPALNSTAATWGGIYFANTTQANRIAYADIEFAGVGGPDTQIASSKADLDHDTWATPGSGQRIIDVTGSSSFSITNSIVGSLVGEEPIHFLGSVFAGGQALIRGNVIGTTTGHNDIIDFTGTNRPAAIFQILDNVFIGTGTGGTVADDILDVDGTDAHIEGNVFMNVQPSGINDTNSAISGGADSGNTSEIVSSRNFFYNVDHAFLMKEGNSVRSINDTIEHVLTGVFNFDEPGFAASPGAGGYADGDVFYDIPSSNGTPKIVQNPPTGVFDVRHSITNAGPMAGIGNLNADPELVNPDGPGPANARVDPALIYTAMTMSPEFRTALARFAPTSGATADMSLKPTSPAIGAGPNGSDMGADVPAGATIGGAPASPTPNNSATITVGGAGIFAYQYKLDSGAWSAAVNVTNPLTNSPVIPPIVLSGLANGQHTISVVYQNDAGAWQSQSTPTTKTWTVNTAIQGRVRINEILADNQTAVNNAGTHPDVIELYNDGKATLDLSGYSISDDAANPRRFVFPAGTSIGAGQYLLLYADDPSAAPGIHLGFALSSTNGEGVFLYDAASTLVDSITFGSQLPDLSIGRVGDGTTWALTTPTLGSANVAMPTGDPDKLKINEWLASGVPPFSADFIELYNPSPLP